MLNKAASGMQRKASGAQRPRHIKEIGEEASTAQHSDAPAQRFIQRFPNLLLPALFAMLWSGPLAAEKADRTQPIQLEADYVAIDERQQTSVFEGNVRLAQGTLLVLAERIVATRDKDGHWHYTATGHTASLRQKLDNEEGMAEGYGERIEYDTRSGLVDFYGQARVKRGQDDLRGEHIRYNIHTETAQASGNPSQTQDPDKGRVHAIIQPRSQQPSVPSTPPQSPPRTKP